MSSKGLMAGKVAVVTGGGGGIGSAICRTLATAGARIVLTYRKSEEKTNEVAASLEGEGHLVVHAPVEDRKALERLADQVKDRYGKVDLLVNNAGVTRAVVHEDLTRREAESAMETLMRGEATPGQFGRWVTLIKKHKPGLLAGLVGFKLRNWLRCS